MAAKYCGSSQMASLTKIVKYSNENASMNLHPFPTTNTDPEAGNEYNAATISGIVFGIFMALLAIYTIRQYGRQYTGCSRPGNLPMVNSNKIEQI